MPGATFQRFEGKVVYSSGKNPAHTTTYGVTVVAVLVAESPKSTMITTIQVEGGPHSTFEVTTPNVTLPPPWKLRMAACDMVKGMMALYRHTPGTISVTLR